MKKEIVYINGKFFNPEEATISVFDRGFLYGDSIYEVTLTYDKKPSFLDEHLDRLEHSANSLMMSLQYTREELKNIINDCIKAVDSPRQYIRLIITRGQGAIGLDPNLADQQNLIILCKDLPEYPVSWYDDGVHLVVADVRRNPKKAIDPTIKSGNYLNNVMAMAQAQQKGAYDAIMLNFHGQVTEATTSNIWMIKNKVVKTPPIASGLLGGITRKALLEILAEQNYSFEEVNFTVAELKSADEIFLSSSTKELVPVTKVDDTAIGSGKPGEITKQLHQYYLEKVRNS